MLKTIKSKLIFLVSVLLAVVLFMGVYSLLILKAVNNKSTIMAQEDIPGIIYSEELNTMTSDFRLLEYEHIISDNISEMDAKEKALEEKNKEIKNYFDNYKKTITTSR